MVRATLDDLKTMTRRVVKGIPDDMQIDWVDAGQIGCSNGDNLKRIKCPYGTVGDRMWVREKYLIETSGSCRYDAEGLTPGQYPDWLQRASIVHYAATTDIKSLGKWRPSIHMPRWASRLTLEIVSVKVERLQDISISDALSEGIRCPDCGYTSKDAGIHMDHGICVNKWLKESKAKDVGDHSAIKAFREIWESINGPGSWDLNPWVWAIEFKKVSA